MISVIGGIMIGLSIDDWLGRFVLPSFVALLSCGELYFTLRKSKNMKLTTKQIRRMKESEMTDQEIDNLAEDFSDINESMMKESGFNSQKLYGIQFIKTYVTTLIVVIATIFIKQLVL